MRRKTRGAMHSKTLWFSAALMIFGAVEMYFPYLERNIDPQYYGPVFLIIGIIVAALRFVTTLPLDNK
jgi:hypothetical protein